MRRSSNTRGERPSPEPRSGRSSLVEKGKGLQRMAGPEGDMAGEECDSGTSGVSKLGDLGAHYCGRMHEGRTGLGKE